MVMNNTIEKDHGLSPPKGVIYGGANINYIKHTKRHGTEVYYSAQVVDISLVKGSRSGGLGNHAIKTL